MHTLQAITARDCCALGPLGHSILSNSRCVCLGLDMDASYLALLAHVLELHGIAVLFCDYHSNGSFVHTAEDSIERYAAVCMSQTLHCLAEGRDSAGAGQRRRIVLVGHSLGGLVAIRMLPQLKDTGVAVSGMLTICSPLKGVPLLSALEQYRLISNFLKRCRPQHPLHSAPRAARERAGDALSLLAMLPTRHLAIR